jgi:hypothetical protein
VRARMVVFWDFEKARVKGPTLAVDGIAVDE